MVDPGESSLSLSFQPLTCLFSFEIIKYISLNNVTIDTRTENCKPEPSLTRVSGVFTKPKRVERVWDGMETSRRNGSLSSEKPQGETTYKTHTDARKMMELYYLEPDCVISTF